MPRKLERWASRRQKRAARNIRESTEGKQIVETIRKEAKERGSTLARDGEGGLDPNLALKVFRRDDYKCQVPKCKTARKDVDLDHIGGHAHEIEEDPEASKWLKEQAEKGKQNTPEGLHCICARHHDRAHDRERAIDNGNKPPPMGK
jgi:5-methylcytosine-specific restriction endonuclease McrA